MSFFWREDGNTLDLYVNADMRFFVMACPECSKKVRRVEVSNSTLYVECPDPLPEACDIPGEFISRNDFGFGPAVRLHHCGQPQSCPVAK
jgi:hypothetical protein